MDIKQLLKTAIDAKIGGDQKGFAEAMKQVVAAKVGQIVAEQDDMGQAPAQEEGEYFFNLEEYDYNGTLVDAGLSINIGHYQAPTQGNYSPTAPDPSTYHGDPEEIEWYVVSANMIMEDGTEQLVTGEEAAALSFNDREQERVTEYLLGQINGDDDEPDYERAERDFDY